MSSYYRSILNVQSVALDPDAEAFLTATGITDATITSAINTFVLDLKGYGIWTKMKAIYPIVGGTAATHKFNLKDPRDLDAAFRLSFFGGITHSINGMQGNGTNGYADTHLNPSIHLSASSAHFSKYNRNNDLAGDKVDGITQSVPLLFFQQNYSGGNGVIGDIASAAFYTPTDTRGLFTMTRTSSSLIKVFRNSAEISTNTSTISVVPNLEFFLMARNGNGLGAQFYNTYQAAFASLGEGLTDAESANLYTAVQTLQTTLSRNV